MEIVYYFYPDPTDRNKYKVYYQHNADFVPRTGDTVAIHINAAPRVSVETVVKSVRVNISGRGSSDLVSDGVHIDLHPIDYEDPYENEGLRFMDLHE